MKFLCTVFFWGTGTFFGDFLYFYMTNMENFDLNRAVFKGIFVGVILGLVLGNK